MRENGPVGAYGRKRFKAHPGAADEADVPNAVARGLGGRAPRTHICGDLACVRVGAPWDYVRLLVDPCNGKVAGRSAGPGRDARLVKSAFATPSFPISDIKAFHTGRGSELDNAEIDPMLEAFGIERSLSAKGRPYDNAVDESTDRILKAELVRREAFGTTCELRAKLSNYAHRYDNFRIHSTPGYMSPVESRETGLSLPESSKKVLPIHRRARLVARACARGRRDPRRRVREGRASDHAQGGPGRPQGGADAQEGEVLQLPG